MPTREITIALTEQTPRARKLKFLPDLSSADDTLVLRQYYEVTTAVDGTGTIDLPVKASGTIRYRYEIPSAVGLSKGSFYLSAGAAIELDDLIAAGGAVTDTVTDYVDSKIVDTVYGPGWNGDISHAPSKNAVYDKIETLVLGGSGDMLEATYDPQAIAGDAFDRANHTGAQAQSTVTNLVTDLALKAPLASPALTGTPTAPTAAPGTNTTQLATTAFIQAAVAALVDASPGTLDTLNELAAALGDDPNFATTITNSLAGKQPLDADLTAIAALISAANKLAYATGAGTWALTDFSAFGRSLVDDADADAGRATLGAVGLTGSETVNGIKTFATDPIIPDEPYDATGWDGVMAPPTKNAIRDKLESMIGGADTQLQYNNAGAFGGSSSLTWDNTNENLTVGGTIPTVSLNDTTGGGSNLRLRSGATSAAHFDIFSVTNNRSLFRVTDAGSTVYSRVGIGPNNIPSEATVFISNNHASGTNVDVRPESADRVATVDVQTNTYATEFRSVFIQASGATVTGTYLTGVNKANAGGLFIGDLTGVIATQTANDLIFGTNSVERLRISATGVITSASDIVVPDEAYGAGWNGSLEVPTKNALYDKIETLGGGGIANSAGNNVVTKSDGTNVVASQIVDDGTTVGIGTTPATAGIIGLPNNAFLYSRNAANSANIQLIGVNASNQIQIGDQLKWNADGTQQYFETTTAVDGASAAFGKRHYNGVSVMSTDGVFSVLSNGFGFAALQVIAGYSGTSPVVNIAGGADAQPVQRNRQASGTQSADLHQWTDNAGTGIFSRVNKAGYLMTRKVAAPADADLANSECAWWFDDNTTTTRVVFKAKDSAGTVKTNSLTLS